MEFVRRRCGYAFPRLGKAGFALSFGLAPRYIRTELFPGTQVTLDLADEVQRATYWQGERFETPTLPILNRWVAEGANHLFDVGSNYGFVSLALLARQARLHVDAFEPNSATFAHLAEIKGENDLDRLCIWNLGLADRCATLALRRGQSDSGHSTLGNHPALGTSLSDTVEIVDFETWRARAGLEFSARGKWIAKIDVEGFELKVLNGMRTALERRLFRGLVVEVNDFTLGFCDTRPGEIYDYMDSLGYVALTKRKDSTRVPFKGNEFFVPR